MTEKIFYPTTDTLLGVWQIKETEQELAADVSAEDISAIKGFHSRKREEFLATRQLMSELCKKHNIHYLGIRKDEFGKPFLIDSDVHISVSHAYPFITCLLNFKESCGIDIERPREQLWRIRHKFLNETELDRCGHDLDKLSLHWCAKETLYKIYGRKKLIFIDNLFVKKIDGESLECEVVVNDYRSKHTLKFFNHSEYFVVYSV